jgi:hypothetical protein
VYIYIYIYIFTHTHIVLIKTWEEAGTGGEELGWGGVEGSRDGSKWGNVG